MRGTTSSLLLAPVLVGLALVLVTVVAFELRAAESEDDKGGKPAKIAAHKHAAVLGVRSIPEAGGCKLTY